MTATTALLEAPAFYYNGKPQTYSKQTRMVSGDSINGTKEVTEVFSQTVSANIVSAYTRTEKYIVPASTLPGSEPYYSVPSTGKSQCEHPQFNDSEVSAPRQTNTPPGAADRSEWTEVDIEASSQVVPARVVVVPEASTQLGATYGQHFKRVEFQDGDDAPKGLDNHQQYITWNQSSTASARSSNTNDAESSALICGTVTVEEGPEDGIVTIEEPEESISAQVLETNDAESLAEGNLAIGDQTELRIMLVGETGVGKTSLLSLISNILQGHSPSEYETVYDPANESGLSGKHSQTMSAKVYKFVSKNGITIHILDTPGLADTRGLAKDEEHKANIAKTIQAHMPFVNAVLILANGTLPRLGVATDYTLSVLSSIFPRSLASNIAFMFTNVSTPLAWNFDKNSLPKVLAEAPQYSLDNPVAMQQRLLQIKKEGKADAKILRRLTTSVATSHNDALDAFVDFFNWAADCKPQPTNEIVSLCQKSEAIEMRLHEAMSKILRRSELKKRLTRMISDLENKTLNLNALRNYESVVAQSIMVTQKTSDYNTLCVHPQCHSNCHESCNLNFHLNPKALLKCTVFDDGKKTTCNKCGHSYRDHRHFYYIWEEHKEEVKAVDEEAKAKFKEALLDRCGGEWMRTWHSKQIKRLDSELADATNEIRTQAQAYASLSLSGSFSAQLYKAIKVLEMNLENIKGKETDPDTIQGIEDSIAQLKEKLRILQSDAE